MGRDYLEVNRDANAALQGSESTGFEKVKNIIADKLQSAAEALSQKGADQDEESATAKYRKQASEWLDHSADSVRKFEYKKADADIRKYVREKPGRSLLIAGAVGLIIGAILRRR
ncbi:MAG: hypothetical protein U1D97_07980 [Desulfuromonadales bacterium]|nr:hypothetical protein [Desulfuromonadales bacterium]